MNGNIKKYMYIGVIVFIVFFVLSIILKMLPWILLVGIIGYIVMKIVGFIKKKSKKNKVTNNDQSYEQSTDDYINGEVIDVEFEDVGDKKR